MKKGLFITIYGINNIGKSTHAKRLVERLKKLGKKAVYIKYPIYDLAPTGPFLDKVLRHSKKQKMPEEELQLWFVLNRYQFQPKLKKSCKGRAIQRTRGNEYIFSSVGLLYSNGRKACGGGYGTWPFA